MHLRVWDDAGLVLYDEEHLQGISVVRDGKEWGVVRLHCEWHEAEGGE